MISIQSTLLALLLILAGCNAGSETPKTGGPSIPVIDVPGGGSPGGTPTVTPTTVPTVAPTIAPTVAPTIAPTVAPTIAPTVAPTIAPTVAPTIAPTVAPTIAPTVAPTIAPTVAPTIAPTVAPTIAPTVAPTIAPTVAPTIAPTVAPTIAPTVAPTIAPTVAPTIAPTVAPTIAPTVTPVPTRTPVPTATVTPSPYPYILTLVAAKHYHPNKFEDGEELIGKKPLTMVIPQRIMVTSGNAGNHNAHLSFDSLKCTYRGGALVARPLARPSNSEQIKLGMYYNFKSCSRVKNKTYKAGDSLEVANKVLLHVDGGDSTQSTYVEVGIKVIAGP